jgi:hypothetical protein
MPTDQRGFLPRFRCNAPRKVSFFAGLGAIVALLVGAGFANMRASGAPTSQETAVIRLVIAGCLLVAVVAYVIGSRMLHSGRS